MLDRKKLNVIPEKTYPADTAAREEEVKNDLAAACITKDRRPSVETSMHNALSAAFIVHLHPTMVNGLMCGQNAEAETARAEADAAKDRLLRTAAEYDNFRKRSAREQDAAFGNGVAHAVSQILSILDTLEMAEAAPTADENFKKGVTLTLEKAKAAFEALKVEEIPALGQPFDPAVHNAVMQKAAENGEESGTVLQVFQKGYKLGDKVIRHATVIVAE